MKQSTTILILRGFNTGPMCNKTLVMHSNVWQNEYKISLLRKKRKKCLYSQANEMEVDAFSCLLTFNRMSSLHNGWKDTFLFCCIFTEIVLWHHSHRVISFGWLGGRYAYEFWGWAHHLSCPIFSFSLIENS